MYKILNELKRRLKENTGLGFSGLAYVAEAEDGQRLAFLTPCGAGMTGTHHHTLGSGPCWKRTSGPFAW